MFEFLYIYRVSSFIGPPPSRFVRHAHPGIDPACHTAAGLTGRSLDAQLLGWMPQGGGRTHSRTVLELGSRLGRGLDIVGRCGVVVLRTASRAPGMILYPRARKTKLF